MRQILAAALLALGLAGCGTSYDIVGVDPGPVAGPAAPAAPAARGRSLAVGVAEYRRAAARIEASAEAMCRETHPSRPPRTCDFDLRLVDDPRIGPNAFQTVRRDGRPVVAMTVQLVAETANADEIAFVLGHEAGHHIADHIAKSRSQAITGALVLGTIASLGNASQDVVSDMMDLGASLGGRAYSQSYELEADVLGAYIAARAGYDPERGSRVFARPALAAGGGLLSTHPASTRRQATVAATAAEIRRQAAAGLTPTPARASGGALF
jgi:Zn-dependent protease with chaperone function